MKKFLSILTAAAMMAGVPFVNIEASAEGIPINSTTFPDPQFRDVVFSKFDTDRDYVLTEEEASVAESLTLPLGTVSVQGIEYLTGITSIYAGDLNADSLILTNCPNLMSIEILNCPKLQTVSLGANAVIENFTVINSNISSFELSEYTSLERIDVSNSKAMTELDVSGLSNLKSLNLTGNVSLCNLNIKDSGLEYVDVSDCEQLEHINAWGSQLSFIDFSDNSAMTDLWLGSTPLTSLDVSKLINLKTLRLQKCAGITSLDVSALVMLEELDVSGCTGITSLDVSNNYSLSILNAYESGLAGIDVSRCLNLTTLDLRHTPVSSIDISNNAKLIRINIDYTTVKSIDVSKNTELRILEIDNTGITSLDLANNPILAHISADCTGLTSLDVSGKSKLEYLYLNSCKDLKSLDVTNCSALRYLDLSDVPLGFLNLDNTGTIGCLYAPVGIKSAEFPNKKLDLKKVFGSDFDISRVSDVTGGVLSGNAVVINDGVSEISYSYDTGNSSVGKLSFTVKALNQKGDTTRNHVVDIGDATAVLAYYACRSAGVDNYMLSDDEFEHSLRFGLSDVDGDGELTLSDASSILAYYSQSNAGLNPAWSDIIK